jgi:hypothetical protein
MVASITSADRSSARQPIDGDPARLSRAIGSPPSGLTSDRRYPAAKLKHRPLAPADTSAFWISRLLLASPDSGASLGLIARGRLQSEADNRKVKTDGPLRVDERHTHSAETGHLQPLAHAIARPFKRRLHPGSGPSCSDHVRRVVG